MPQLIPMIPTVPFYRFGTALDGIQFIFDVRWNGRDGAWYMDISTEDDILIAAGIKIVLGVLLGYRSVDPAFPRGGIIASDLSNTGRDATLDDLGTRVAVYFFPFAELA